MNKSITIQSDINADINKVWSYWTEPQHITHWAFASDDWEAPFAENDLKVGGKFTTRMSAKDKSAGFDFNGVYTDIKEHELIEYDMEDGRKASIKFLQIPNGIRVIETFDMEHENSEELQRSGWQAIMNNFKKYTEEH